VRWLGPTGSLSSPADRGQGLRSPGRRDRGPGSAVRPVPVVATGGTATDLRHCPARGAGWTLADMSTPSTAPDTDDDHVLAALYGEEFDVDTGVDPVLLGRPDVPVPAADDDPRGDEMMRTAERPAAPADGSHDARP
jgi:hypothetical protein